MIKREIDVFVDVVPDKEDSNLPKNEDDIKEFIVAFADFLENYKIFIFGCMAVLSVTFMIVFLFFLMKLGKTSANPMERQKTLNQILAFGICSALFGAISLVFGLAFSIFQ